MCGNMYPTPQEWVRHIQTEHTEEQLALMNNSAPPKPKRVHSHQKLCNICQKGINFNNVLPNFLK